MCLCMKITDLKYAYGAWRHENAQMQLNGASMQMFPGWDHDGSGRSLRLFLGSYWL